MKYAFSLGVAAMSMMLSTGVMAQGKQDFTLVNKTGYAINEVYVSPTSANDWQEDVLGQDVLANGDNVHIRFNRSTSACNWDLKIVYDDKTSAEWTKFDLCTVSKISIMYNRATDTTSATYE